MLVVQELRGLPKWKTLEEARRERMAALQQRIQELHAKLVTLQAEAPDNTNCGWFSFGNNESFELDRQFTTAKDSIARAEAELYLLTTSSSRPSPRGRAAHGNVVVLVNSDEHYQCYRLVLTPEQDKDDERIKHVEIASPVGAQLLGVEEGDEITLRLGQQFNERLEVVAVI
jgi:transcription elongation GreA/GreB family factor